MEKAAVASTEMKGNLKAVGEDSNLCDKAKALGFRIVVNTNAVCNHMHKEPVTPQKHLEAMENLRKQRTAVVGVLE